MLPPHKLPPRKPSQSINRPHLQAGRSCPLECYLLSHLVLQFRSVWIAASQQCRVIYSWENAPTAAAPSGGPPLSLPPFRTAPPPPSIPRIIGDDCGGFVHHLRVLPCAYCAVVIAGCRYITCEA
jgi:hypothetical protein